MQTCSQTNSRWYRKFCMFASADDIDNVDGVEPEFWLPANGSSVCFKVCMKLYGM